MKLAQQPTGLLGRSRLKKDELIQTFVPIPTSLSEVGMMYKYAGFHHMFVVGLDVDTFVSNNFVSFSGIPEISNFFTMLYAGNIQLDSPIS